MSLARISPLFRLLGLLCGFVGAALSGGTPTPSAGDLVLTNPGDQTTPDRWTYAQAVDADNAVAHWRLDSLTGESAQDRVGYNPGTAVGGVTTGQPGALADASASTLFDGATGYIAVPDSPTLELAGDLSIELWLNVAMSTRQTLVSKGYLHEFELTLDPDGELLLYQGNGSTYSSVAGPARAITQNVWHHVVVTRAGRTNAVCFYVDGIARSGGTSATSAVAGTNPLTIGRSSAGGNFVNGYMQDVAVYGTVLTPAQVAQHWALRAADGSGTPTYLQVGVSDSSGLPLTFSATGLPPGLVIDSTTGLISGTLTSGSAGSYLVTVTVSNGIASQDQAFTWTVTDGAPAPALSFQGAWTNPSIDVMAPGQASYRYRINDAPYSPEFPITTPITLSGTVTIDGHQFTPGTRPLNDFLALKNRDDSFTDFFDHITVNDAESDLQVTYMVNRLRTQVQPENVLNLSGAGVSALNAAMIETVNAGPQFELSSLMVDGGQLTAVSSTASLKTLRLTLPPVAAAITLTAQTDNLQTTITINGQRAAAGQAVSLAAPGEGSSILVSAVTSGGAVVSYQLNVHYDSALSAQAYRSFYLRAFTPSGARVSITSSAPTVITYGITFNQKFGITLDGLVNEVTTMAEEYPGEPMQRKVWRFIRDNRYHFGPLTRARWSDSPALFFNSIGFGFCNDTASLFYHLLTAMGYTARIWSLSGRHVVAEVLINNRWEMWDPDLQVYYLTGNGLIAGVQDLAANPDLVLHPMSPVAGALPDAYSAYVAGIYGTTANTFVDPGAIDLPVLNDSTMLFQIPPDGAFEFPGVFDAPLSALYMTRVPSYADARLIVPEGFAGTVSTPLVIQSVGWTNTPRVAVITKSPNGTWDAAPTGASWSVDIEAPFTVASQPSGVYNAVEPITLTTSEPATIHYTVDGTTPTLNSPVYSVPVMISPGAAVRFFAIDGAGNTEPLRTYGPAVSSVQLQALGQNASTMTFAAQGVGGTGSYEYLFRFYDPLAGWSTVQQYSAAPTWTWNRSAAAPGTYGVEVWVRNAGTTGLLDASAALSFNITPTAAPTLANPGDQLNTDSSTTYQDAVVEDRASLYWRLNDISTVSATDSVGGDAAAIVGGVVDGQSGAVWNDFGMAFDGTSGYLTAANTPSVGLAGDLTLELWINSSLGVRQTLVSKGYLSEFELTLETDGQLNFYHGNGNGYENVASVRGAVTANTWQYIVVTRTSATNTVQFYVNGAAKGRGTYALTPALSARSITIGRSAIGTQYVGGLLGEVAIYTNALTASQVATHYALRTANGTGSGTPIALQLIASDPNGDQISYGAIGLPPGLAVNATSGLISGTLTPASAGTYPVTISASNGLLSSTQTFTWAVTHVDRAPVLVNPGAQTNAEGSLISLTVTASDPDGDRLMFSATGLPPGLSIDPSSGRIDGTLSFASAGTWPVIVSVSDGALSASATFTWSVSNVDRPPILTNPGAQTSPDRLGYAEGVLGDEPSAYWRLDDGGVTAADAVGSSVAMITGDVTPGQPGALADGDTAMAFDGMSGYLSVPNPAAFGLAGDLTLELWIKTALGVRQTLISKGYLSEFELTLETDGQLNFYEGNGSTYQNVASTAAAVAPNAWQHVVVTRSAATSTIQFYVNGVAKGGGTYTLTPTTSARPITLGRSAIGTQYVAGQMDEVALYTAALSASQVAAHYALRTANGTGTPIALQLVAFDPDGDPISFGATGLPPGVTADPATGLISGTLTSASDGTYAVAVSASDGQLTATQGFTWTVTHVDRAPVITNPGAQTSAEGTMITLPVAASDPDGDTLTFSATGLPQGLSIDSASGAIAGTLSYASAGTWPVIVTVSDGALAATASFTWSVSNVNRAPVLTNPGPQTNPDASGYAQAVLADAPSAYWRLGEGSGTTAADVVASNAATINGGVTLGQPGALADGNTAMGFNGVSGYLSVPNPAAFNLSADLTLELWVNTPLITRQTLISKGYLSEFELTLETSGALNLYEGNGATYQNVASAGRAVTANTWQHIVVTRTAATSMVQFYVNGTAKGSGTYTLTPTSSSRPITIGRSAIGTQYLAGRIDEVAVYAKALTAAQVATHYALRTAGNGTPIALQLVASDPDGHSLSYGATGLPPGLTLDATTGLISGTVTSASDGTFTVMVSASDGVLTAAQTFTWTITAAQGGG